MSMEIGGYSPYLYTYPQFNNRIAFRANPANIPSIANNSAQSYATPPDVVEISASDEIKGKKDKGISTGAKVVLGLLGTGAAIYGCVVGHRMLNKPSLEKVAKNFSEIFRRDISKDEAQKMANQYKEIFKIKDKDEFVQKAFEQIKNDYGYKELDIPLVFENLGGVINKKQAQAHWNQFHGNIAINTEMLKNLPQNLAENNQRHLIDAITHEFQHVKQAEYAFRTNKQEYLNNICNYDIAPERLLSYFEEEREFMTKSLLENNPNLFKTEKEVSTFIDKSIIKLKNGSYKNDKEIMDMLEDVVNQRHMPTEKLFGKLKKFDKNSENYNKGLSYINAGKEYSNSDMEIYNASILEKEAFGTAEKLQSLYKYIVNPWKIF